VISASVAAVPILMIRSSSISSARRPLPLFGVHRDDLAFIKSVFRTFSPLVSAYDDGCTLFYRATSLAVVERFETSLRVIPSLKTPES